MLEGGCCCGAVRIKSTGEIQAKALCHCLDCRKITGSTYSTNIIVAGNGFAVTKGTPKEFPKKADSGKTITSFFCGDCGSTLWRESDTFGDTKIIKVGVMDGEIALEDAKPVAELYIAHRVSWVSPIPGAEQKDAMSLWDKKRKLTTPVTPQVRTDLPLLVVPRYSRVPIPSTATLVRNSNPEKTDQSISSTGLHPSSPVPQIPQLVVLV
ncbi:hypothetical protein CC78DRAFT_585231 [Lojkania enalia]|uniref:CENP-V/GFA domain-containing protein n=1 Tax=Lojkania enalia TaxID=147567 RepID=A0A9P4K4S3_9PLEO|nr:hypothetical protein CC78DRAFT_585231 [Didymosphaeria enalia]